METFETFLGNAFNADCFEVMRGMPDGSVDMILADLPYGTTACKWDVVIPFEPLWAEFHRITKPSAAIVLTASQPFTSALVMSNVRNFRHEWVYEKTSPSGHLNAKRRPMRAHEDVVVFSRSACAYFPQKTSGHSRKVATAAHRRNCQQGEVYGDFGLHTYDSTERYPRSVQKFPTDKQKLAIHPTQKPVVLFEYLIRTYTQEGDLVFDPTAGSLTTGVAAENTGRKWICAEKDSTYFEKAKSRFKIYDPLEDFDI